MKGVASKLKQMAKAFARRVKDTIKNVSVTPETAGVAPLAPTKATVKLSGLELRAVRTRSRAFPTRRMGRSKYLPDGIPARTTKQAKALQGSL